jgi:molybdopterin/thiamine biosynthesis adenylyltransferase
MSELRISANHFRRLRSHLLRADLDEHGAVLLVGCYAGANGTLLTVREVHLLAEDEFTPGDHGYRQLAASALARLGNRAADERLAMVTIHSHPGAGDRNSLSGDDLRAHERVFPHLLDITGADTVAGVALGERSVAGELWHTDGTRTPLDRLRVVGPNVRILRPAPSRRSLDGRDRERFDRQVRLFGEAGQELLRDQHVAVVGAGGGGSILIEQLAHLGVGRITAIDYDVVKRHNLSRIMGATDDDARRQTKKVEVARRLVTAIDPSIAFDGIDGDIADLRTAEKLLGADYVLLATDTVTARLVANAVAQTFLIPLIQIGAKVEIRQDGTIEQIYTAVRPVLPAHGCLACAGLIDPVALQREAAAPDERANQNYLGDSEVIDPSVTTLNAAAAAGALNVLLMSVMGQASDELAAHRIMLTREGAVLPLQPQRDAECRWCGETSTSRFARADVTLLPCRGPHLVGSRRSATRHRWLRRLLGPLSHLSRSNSHASP